MKKSKKKFKSNKLRILLIILFISMFIVIPNLLISIQRNSEIPIDEKNLNEIINTRPPQASSPYYEATTGYAIGVYVSGDYAYVADGNSGLAVIGFFNPIIPFGNSFLIFIGFSVIYLIFTKKRQIVREAR